MRQRQETKRRNSQIIPAKRHNSQIILPQFKLGLAMPPEKKVGGLSRERVW